MTQEAFLWAVTAGFCLDFCMGDPYWLPHPIRWIGSLIVWLEPPLRQVFKRDKRGEFWAGLVLVIFVLAFTGLCAYGALALAFFVHPAAGWVMTAVMSHYLLAAGSLKRESMKVYDGLQAGDVERARQAVSMIVGRDTGTLDQQGIIKAAVETVAENTSDGVVAPLFYLILGGPVLGFLYKAVNTMDSMVGYHNERYEYFGKGAARLDDICNWLPARLSAWLMLVASLMPGFNGALAFFVYLRDRHNHKSPNSAQTEAVCAGALKIQLAGDAWYFGKLVKKPTIGDPVNPVSKEDIKRANQLMYATALLSLVCFCGIRWRLGI